MKELAPSCPSADRGYCARMLRSFAPLTLTLLLAACVSTPSDDGLPTEPTQFQTEAGTVTVLPLSDEVRRPEIKRSFDDRCGARSLAGFVGQHESIFFSVDFPEDTRFIGPGDAVTQDSKPRRINFDIGADGRVSRVWCG